MKRGKIEGFSDPVMGIDLAPLIQDPGKIKGLAYRHMGREGQIRFGEVDLEAMGVLAAMSMTCRIEMVTWGPEVLIRGKFRKGLFPGRIKVFDDKRMAASYVVGKKRMLFYMTADKELAAMIPHSSGTEVVDPEQPSEEFKAAIRFGRDRNGR